MILAYSKKLESIEILNNDLIKYYYGKKHLGAVTNIISKHSLGIVTRSIRPIVRGPPFAPLYNTFYSLITPTFQNS